MPMEPVNPTRSGPFVAASATERLDKRRAKLGRDLGRDPEPGRKRRNGLVHEHPQSVHGAMPAFARSPQQLGFKWIVDNVRNRGGAGQGRKVDFELRLSSHPKTC